MFLAPEARSNLAARNLARRVRCPAAAALPPEEEEDRPARILAAPRARTVQQGDAMAALKKSWDLWLSRLTLSSFAWPLSVFLLVLPLLRSTSGEFVVCCFVLCCQISGAKNRHNNTKAHKGL